MKIKFIMVAILTARVRLVAAARDSISNIGSGFRAEYAPDCGPL
jgi:hypothetical protein